MEFKEITEIYVSQSNGYFISKDLQNALKLTQDFVAKTFNTTMIVSKKKFFIKNLKPNTIHCYKFFHNKILNL